MKRDAERRFASRALLIAAPILVCRGSMPRAALAIALSIPLPQLVGPIDFFPNTGGRAAQFDFGQEFSQINHVWLEVEATVKAREFDFCGTVGNPQECVHVVQLLGFWSIMDDDGTLGTVATDGLNYSDEITDLEGSGVAISEFDPFPVGWNFLLSGKGSLTLFWNRLLGNPDRIIRNVLQPSGEIFNARLIIDAVPEPSAWEAVVVVFLAAAARRRIA